MGNNGLKFPKKSKSVAISIAIPIDLLQLIDELGNRSPTIVKYVKIGLEKEGKL